MCIVYIYKRGEAFERVHERGRVSNKYSNFMCIKKIHFEQIWPKCLKMYAQKILRWGSNFTKWQRSLNFKVFLFYKFVLPLMVSKWKSSWHLGEGSSSFRCIIFSTHVGFPSTPLNCMVFRIIISDIFIHCFTPVKNNYLR